MDSWGRLARLSRQHDMRRLRATPVGRCPPKSRGFEGSWPGRRVHHQVLVCAAGHACRSGCSQAAGDLDRALVVFFMLPISRHHSRRVSMVRRSCMYVGQAVQARTIDCEVVARCVPVSGGRCSRGRAVSGVEFAVAIHLVLPASAYLGRRRSWAPDLVVQSPSCSEAPGISCDVWLGNA